MSLLALSAAGALGVTPAPEPGVIFKNQSRLPLVPAAAGEEPGAMGGPALFAFGPPPMAGPIPGPGMSAPWGFGARGFGPAPGGEPWRIPSPRRICAGEIDREGGIAGYLRSRLRLTPDQTDAWRRLDEAAQAAWEGRRQLCDTLPDEAGPPPSTPERLAFFERLSSARTDFLRAVAEPLRAFYAALTPEQRAILDRPPLPPRRD